LTGQNQDTILFAINMMKYENVAKQKLTNMLTDSCSDIYGKYKENELEIFSIPVVEWNHKAQCYTCDSHEKLENLLLFTENPYFQMILFIDSKLNVVGNLDIAISESRNEKRIKDSIEWVSQIPNLPFFNFSTDPFPFRDLLQEKMIYKYHIKHPDIFIFRIAYYEGFWIIKDNKLYKLDGNSIINANQVFYMDGEEYIRDIASGNGIRTGYKYIGCFNRSDARHWSKKGNDIFIKVSYP
jgi:hypothetical protein